MSTITLVLQQAGPTAMSIVDQQFEILIDRPVEKGGGGQGLMGGQFLLAGIGGCYCSNVFAIAQAREVSLKGLSVTVEARVSVSPPSRFEHVRVTVKCQACSDPEMLPKILRMAEKACISLNTIKQGMEVTIATSDHQPA